MAEASPGLGLPRALLVVAVLLCFGSAVVFKLTYDSVAIVGMDRRIAEGDAAALLSGDWWDRQETAEGLDVKPSLWRPLTKLWFMALHPRDGRLRGAADGLPFVMLGGLVLQCVTALLRFEILRRLLPSTRAGVWAATLAAALTVLHPLNAEVIGTAVGSADALATVLSSVALLLALEGNGFRTACGILLATMCALAAKESAIVTPLFVGVLVALAAPRAWRRMALLAGASAAGALTFLLVRRAILGEFLGVGDPVYQLFHPLDRVATALAVIATFDVPALLLPFSIHPNLGLVDVPPATAGDARALLGLGVVVLLFSSLVWLWLRKRHRAAAGLLLLMAGLFPVSNLLFSIGAMGAARFFHLPLFGLALLLADLLLPYCSRPRNLVLGMAGVLMLGVLAHRELGRWESDEQLFSSMVKEEPGNPTGHYNLGVLEQQRGKTARALEHFIAAADIELPRIPGVDVIQEDLLELRFQAAMNAGGLATIGSQENPALLVCATKELALALSVSAEGLKSAAFGARDSNWTFLRAEALTVAARVDSMRAHPGPAPRALELLAEARGLVPGHTGADLAEAGIAESRGDISRALALSTAVVERSRLHWSRDARARNEARDHIERLRRVGREAEACSLALDVALAGAGMDDPTALFDAASGAERLGQSAHRERIIRAYREFLKQSPVADVTRRARASAVLQRLGG